MMKIKGQMLIEIVIAVGVLSLVLIGVSDLMTRSQRLSGFQAKQEEAISVAREILNDYRVQMENDPDNFESQVAGLNRPICVTGKDFTCAAVVTKNSGSVDVSVNVSWPDGENTLSVDLKQTLNKI